MNRADAFNALVQAFIGWIDTNHPALVGKVQYPDLDFTPPAPGNPWIRWNMQWSGSVGAGVGKTEDRHTGLAMIELFWPAATAEGYKTVNEMADAVAAFYRTFTADTGRLRCAGPDAERPSISTPPRETGMTKRVVNVPVRLMEFIS